MENDIKALREEVAKLRERIAVLESRSQTGLSIDWSKPVIVGTAGIPQWANPAPAASPSITC